jgi:hypothetical protein
VSAAAGVQAAGSQRAVTATSTVNISGTALRQGGTTISGTVRRQDGTTAADVRLRLRNVDKGTVVGQTMSDKTGAFSFPVTDPGFYVVEAVDGGGSVLAVSSAIQPTATPLTVNLILPATRNAAGFFSSTAFLILAAAAGAGVVIRAVNTGTGGTVTPVSPEQ